MNAGKNRKRDLELLSEVYSEGMAKYYDAQATGNYDSSGNPLDNVGGHETHSDYAGEAEDQNPVENYEGEEESQQTRSARQLEDEGYTGGRADNKGNLIFRKSGGKMYADHASVDTDGQINGQPAQEFFRQTGVEDAEDFGSPNSNRSGWGSGAFTHPGGDEATDEDEHQSIRGLAKQMAHEDEGGILDVGDCEAEPGKIDVVVNPASAFGIRDILKNIFGKEGEEGQEEDAAAAMRADERENRKNLNLQDVLAKKSGFNPDENQEEFPWPKEVDDDEDFDDFEGDDDTNEADQREFKKIDPEQWAKAKKAGWSGGASENEEYDEDEVDREGRYKKRWGKNLDDEKDRKGSSNAGEYTHVDKGEFCGPSGGAADGTYPVNTRKRAEAAKRLAHNAPNPSGIKKCADRALAKDSYYSSKGDRAMTQLMESYEQVLQNELL
jgi:hypothetical protein